jgi:hypothetical protein
MPGVTLSESALMKLTFWRILAILLTAAAIGSGCRSTTPSSNDQEFSLTDSQSQDQQGDDFEDDDTESDLGSKTRLSHPKDATAWNTRRLILSVRQPSASDISGCFETVVGAMKAAQNLQALEDASVSLQGNISKNSDVYHWCFYQMMADLDEKLDKNLPLMSEKAELFLERMSQLWVLGTALSDATGTDLYVKYLRTRYTDISQTTFGRRLETVNPDALIMSNQGRGKSAGSFNEQ